jgi:signal transduction histidine kinase
MITPSPNDRELTDLLVSVMNAREQEGARISKVLHDEVGQVLSAIGLQLDLLRMDLAEHVADAPRRIDEIQKVLELAVAQVRDLSYELNPSVVQRTGLQFALDRLVGRCRKQFPGNVRLLFDSSLRAPVEQATAMYKIAELALDNALQHAESSQIEIHVKPSRQAIVLEVRDNGVGFSAERAAGSRGLGLHLMRYHAERAGLQFTIAPAQEKGTIVRATYKSRSGGGSGALE